MGEIRVRIFANVQFDLLRTVRAHYFNGGGVKLLADFYRHRIFWWRLPPGRTQRLPKTLGPARGHAIRPAIGGKIL
ncbi:hypothetical protein CFter6_2156 [Collimonas fungivorans]|uniref:Uncharacterized protein n=1 Tax=Collimonas fungivorans TaxID=158899 RepID=A0A127PB55_9BURK|nr:hypothetical protein CFter6_2156 [Collimonas fungivorans]